jgi:hypothetical protein
MQIPQPPVVSRARPPRPKFDYTRLRLVGASQLAGHTTFKTGSSDTCTALDLTTPQHRDCRAKVLCGCSTSRIMTSLLRAGAHNVRAITAVALPRCAE